MLLFVGSASIAQVGINTDNSLPNANAMLDVKSNSKGFLLPRLRTVQRITLGSIATAGLMVYDTDLDQLFIHDGTTWNDISTGNLWTRNGTNTYVTNTDDNVGIGTNSPGYVAGAARYLSVSTLGLGGNQIASFELKGTSGTTFLPVTRIDFLSQSTIGIQNIARIETRITNSQAEGELLFYTNGGALTERMRIDENGNVGIGATAPDQKLTVDGTFGILEGGASPTNHTIFQGGTQASNITYTLPVDDGSSGEMLTTDGVGVLAWTPAESPLTISNGLTRAANAVKLGGNLTESTIITQDAAESLIFTNNGTGETSVNLASTGDFRIEDNGSAFFTATNGGKIGIGTMVPGQKLTVDGTIGILEGGASPTNHTIFQGGVQAANITYTLPVDDGSGGEMLTTDGVGVLAWTPAESPLSISNGLTRTTNTVKLGGNLTENTTITQDAAESLIFTNSGTGETSVNLASAGDFRIEDNGSAFFTATDGGNVGIGTTTPGQKLTVDGTFGILEGGASPTHHTIFQGGSQSADIGYTLPVNDGNSGQMLTTDGTGVLGWDTPVSGNGSSGRVAFWWNGSGLTSNSELFWDDTHFRLGIGVSNPGQKLTVAGTIQTTSGGIMFPDGTTQTTAATNDLHTIGESYGGGIVFYVYDGGRHGLIAATADQSTGIRWNAGTNLNTMAFANGVGSGKANTTIIIASQGYGDGASYAARVCNEYWATQNGVTYGDWYLPSKHELNLLYLQKSVVGGFADFNYWSSDERAAISAYIQSFDTGSTNFAEKAVSAIYVRAIRAF